jgi:Zn-dependent membrane protease YugP
VDVVLLVLLTLLLVGLAFAPMAWVRFVMARHDETVEDMPGTGGDLARHLIERFGLNVKVEPCAPHGDHFDPKARAVRLSESNLDGKSLTAIAIAAHEVGHAMQCVRGEKVFELRTRWLPLALRLKKTGIMLMAAAPVAALLVRSPAAMLALAVASLGLQLLGALAYLIVLPEELDASFNKALPILTEGDYIGAHQIAPVRQVLRAAAWTYFAAALAEVVNIGRWLVLLRR